MDKQEEMVKFNDVCRTGTKRGPVVAITGIMDRALLVLEGIADYFFQLGKIKSGEEAWHAENRELSMRFRLISGGMSRSRGCVGR